MKKIIMLLLALFAISFYAHSQVNPHALGARLSGGSFVGAELSYQQGLGNTNRFELDLGVGGDRFYLAGIYHWNWNVVGAFNWYLGPGASLGAYSFDNPADFINIGVGGQIGLEYDFSRKGAPFLLSLDYRPMWSVIGDNSGLSWGAALGIRYVW